jgi:hypothetical protein
MQLHFIVLLFTLEGIVQLSISAKNFSFEYATLFLFFLTTILEFHALLQDILLLNQCPFVVLKLDTKFLSFLHKENKYLMFSLPSASHMSVICCWKKFLSNYPRLVAMPAGRGYCYRFGLHPARHWTRSTSGKEKNNIVLLYWPL